MRKKSEAQEQLINAFRAYLQTVITAEQFGAKAKLSSLPGAKTVDYCAALAEAEDNTLARELAAPVWAILDEIRSAAMYYHRPLFQKTIKDVPKQQEHERILYQLDFALALIMRRFASMVHFRAKWTKCQDLLCDTIVQLNRSSEAADLIRRWQKEFPEDEREADGSVMSDTFPHSFAWDTYLRVEELDRLVDEFPDHVKTAARQMHGWPMLAHRHTNNRKRFHHLAKLLELGTEYPLDATEGARFRPDTPLVRYLDPLICKLAYVRSLTEDETYETVVKEKELLRRHLWDGQNELPNDEEIEGARALRELPPLTKATANDWAEKAIVPAILATDARDWKNCREPALQRIAKQKGVKSRATFKSRLLSAVASTLRRLAHPA